MWVERRFGHRCLQFSNPLFHVRQARAGVLSARGVQSWSLSALRQEKKKKQLNILIFPAYKLLPVLLLQMHWI